MRLGWGNFALKRPRGGQNRLPGRCERRFWEQLNAHSEQLNATMCHQGTDLVAFTLGSHQTFCCRHLTHGSHLPRHSAETITTPAAVYASSHPRQFCYFAKTTAIPLKTAAATAAIVVPIRILILDLIRLNQQQNAASTSTAFPRDPIRPSIQTDIQSETSGFPRAPKQLSGVANEPAS